MKTNFIATPLKPSFPRHPISRPSRLSGLSKALLATTCVSLVSFAAIPEAQAGKVNGTYEVKTTHGSLEYAGHDIDVPDALVQRIVRAANGEITIRNRTLKLRKKGAVNIVEEIADDLHVDVETSVTGPSSVKLQKLENVAKGRTSRPVVVSFEGDVFGEDFSGKLITRVRAIVKGRTLTIVVRFSGDAVGSDFSGRVRIVAKR